MFKFTVCEFTVSTKQANQTTSHCVRFEMFSHSAKWRYCSGRLCTWRWYWWWISSRFWLDSTARWSISSTATIFSKLLWNHRHSIFDQHVAMFCSHRTTDMHACQWPHIISVPISCTQSNCQGTNNNNVTGRQLQFINSLLFTYCTFRLSMQDVQTCR